MIYAIEVLDGTRHGVPHWVRCEADGKEYRASSRGEAETDARFSLDRDVLWRVVPVEAKG